MYRLVPDRLNLIGAVWKLFTLRKRGGPAALAPLSITAGAVHDYPPAAPPTLSGLTVNYDHYVSFCGRTADVMASVRTRNGRLLARFALNSA